MSLVKLVAVEAQTRRYQLPWLLVGDWNMTPAELVASGWPRRLRGGFMQPAGCEITCTPGKGRMLDYCLVSP